MNRQVVRWVVLLAAVVLAWPWRGERSTSLWLPATSPFITVASAISVRAVGLLALAALPVLVLAVAYRRWFCRHGCPVGLLQELVARIRLRGSRSWHRCPAIGEVLVWLTLGGGLLGYPLFLWLDPLAIFNGFLNAWRQPIALATLLTGLGLPLLLLLDLAVPRLWCRRLCPLGAAQDLLRRPLWLPHVLADRGPRRRSGRRQSARTDVGGYGLVGGPRRWFFALGAGGVGALAIRTTRGQTPPPLRPPGALDEPRFTGVCVRCGNCAQVCPSGIIQPDFGTSGVAGFLTPRLRFDTDYCREECHRCNRVCPSGAIARLSLAEKRRRIIGLARLDADLCLAVLGRECNACAQACPYQAITMDSTLDPFSPRPHVDPDRCNGCGACEAVCPTRPARAMCVK